MNYKRTGSPAREHAPPITRRSNLTPHSLTFQKKKERKKENIIQARNRSSEHASQWLTSSSPRDLSLRGFRIKLVRVTVSLYYIIIESIMVRSERMINLDRSNVVRRVPFKNLFNKGTVHRLLYSVYWTYILSFKNTLSVVI